MDSLITLDSLPVEIVFHLMQFLNATDRQMLGLTCHRLHEIWLECDVEGDRRIVIREDTVREIVFNRRIKIVVLQDVQFNDDYLSWLNNNIQSLELHNCEIEERTLINMISKCTNLQSLHLVNCNSLFMSGNLLEKQEDISAVKNVLSRVRELNLARNRYLSDSLFNRLVEATPNICSLSLAHCQIAFHPAIYRRFYPPSQSSPSISIFTFQNVLKCIRQRSEKIKILNLSHTLVDNDSLNELSSMPNLCLEKIYLSACDQLAAPALISLCRRQRHLRSLDLSQCSRCNDQVVKSAFDFLPQLRHFNLKTCRSVQNLMPLQKNNELRSLNVSGCENLLPTSLSQLLDDDLLSCLTSLNLSACALDQSTVVSLAQHAPNLRHLDLSSCRVGITDSSFQAICQGLVWLRSLKVAWCELVTDNGLEHVACVHGLRHLDMCACVQVTDVGVKRAIRFIELQTLNLSLCKELTDDGVVSLGEANPSVEKVLLSQCTRLTDVGISSAIAHWRRLKYLDVQGCKQLSDKFLLALSFHCPNLRFLDVSMCFGISQDGIRQFEQRKRCQIHYRHINPVASNEDRYTQNL